MSYLLDDALKTYRLYNEDLSQESMPKNNGPPLNVTFSILASNLTENTKNESISSKAFVTKLKEGSMLA